MIGALRFPARTAGFVGLTFSMYGALEVETALAPRASRNEVLYKWIERYGRALCALYGADVSARGPHVGEGRRYPGAGANGRGRVFVMNHRSGLDIPVNLAFVEATIVSRSDLSGWPVIGMAARRVGTLFVDRSSKKSGAAVIVAMKSALERGRGVLVYPEGTTFAGDEVRPFKPGAFLAATSTGAEVVPMGIAYGGDAATYLEEPFLDHMKRVSRTKATRVALEVGDPIAGDDAEDLRARAHAAVQALVHRARASLGSG